MKELGIRNKNERTKNVIRNTWNNNQHMKVQSNKKCNHTTTTFK